MPQAPPELVTLARDWLEAGLRRDTDLVRELSHTEDPGSLHTIASAPGDCFTLDGLVSHLGGAPPLRSSGSDPKGFVHGDVAWLVDLPTIDLGPYGVLEVRHTVVLHRVAGTWKVVHSHMSEGVDPMRGR